MTKREAKRYVARIAALSLREDIAGGAEWIYAADEQGVRGMRDPYVDRPVADVRRITAAIDDLATELERRAGEA